MDEKQLHRVFAQIKPSPEQEEVMLASLLTQKRRVTPVKTMKKTVTLATAAALLLLACAFTVMTDLDQRLLEHLGVRVDDVELLSPVARPVDVEVTDNGATLNVRQVMMDRTGIMFQLDFTAPEGTVLDADNYYFSNPDRNRNCPCLITQDGNFVTSALSYGGWGNLADEDPTDNRTSMSFVVGLDEDELDGIDPFATNIRGLWFPAVDLVLDPDHPHGDDVLSGNWSCEIPLEGMTDPGWAVEVDETYDHDLLDLSLDEIYLSPMTLSFGLCLNGEVPWEEPICVWREDAYYETWIELLDKLGYGVVTLTSPEGQSVEMQLSDSLFAQSRRGFVYRLAEIIDPAEFQGGTLTIEGQTYSLDGLSPVSP